MPRRRGRDRGLRVDLDDQLRQRQPGDDQPGADRADLGETLCDHGIDLGAIAAVDDAGGELGQAGERAAGLLQRRLEPVERRVGLGGRVADAGDAAIGVERARAAEEDAFAGAHRSGDGLACKAGEGGWSDGVALHGVSAARAPPRGIGTSQAVPAMQERSPRRRFPNSIPAHRRG